MIKDLIFGGSYKDENISMEIMLVNPAEHNYGNNTLTFEVRITMKGIATDFSEWNFYIMDEQNHIYNAADVTELSRDGVSTITVLAAYHFRPEYLYNDLRLGFLYVPYNCIYFLGISH
jgi:hypothetical protein